MVRRPGLNIAATQRCPVRGRMLVGEVDDLNAYALGGVAGHAGLFGTVGAVAALAHELCAAYRGASARSGRPPLVEAAVLRTWGGQAVVLPYLDGHSTTALVERSRV